MREQTFAGARKVVSNPAYLHYFPTAYPRPPGKTFNRLSMEPNVAASETEAVATVTLPEWVVFSCDDQLFGVPLLLTREVTLPQPLTRLPGCGAEVGGLMGLRGRVITVFDLGIVLGRRSVLHRDYRILVVDHDERVAGLAVDSVAEIERN